MYEQFIIVISREFGSGGHEIASALAKKFGIPFYDKNILEQITQGSTLSLEELKHYDESPRNMFMSRSVRGFDNAPQTHVAKMQFSYLREKAAQGESFVLLGRCGEEVLKDVSNLISVFVLADTEFKKTRIMARGDTDEDTALELMARNDRRRKYYHNQYCRGKWGDSRNYDLCINSARLGIEGTVEYLGRYICARIDQK